MDCSRQLQPDIARNSSHVNLKQLTVLKQAWVVQDLLKARELQNFTNVPGSPPETGEIEVELGILHQKMRNFRKAVLELQACCLMRQPQAALPCLSACNGALLLDLCSWSVLHVSEAEESFSSVILSLSGSCLVSLQITFVLHYLDVPPR